ncbi:MAG: hypothetical protein ISS36_00670 [Candidatus Aenigmarchaeota archaeon]|nr:hypothetical protein [Candidatus Aenigmarchaeota archaeon]
MNYVEWKVRNAPKREKWWQKLLAIIILCLGVALLGWLFVDAWEKEERFRDARLKAFQIENGVDINEVSSR